MSRPCLSLDEEKLRRLWPLRTGRQLAAEFGVAIKTVTREARRLGLPKKRAGATTAYASRDYLYAAQKKPAADEAPISGNRVDKPVRESADPWAGWGRCFADDPAARRDPGSTDRLQREAIFGRSACGSSLA